MHPSRMSNFQSSLCPVAMSCYSASGCAAIGALFGLASSHFPAVGFAAIAGAYLIAGLVDQFVVVPLQRRESILPMHPAASGAENLVAEAVITVTRPRDLATSTH
ncbi:hypothetical protein [Schlesneria paludicola]|uniref:hypothetical protein n=1 Tax=Schlesneria paludicola TaxID=360056 RepID=UPI0012FCBE0D|nr:hypothetical protein [Schlesneria paludicola]